jgi:two-component system cell cycle sensor histidine kinase/response regulator CckA
VTEVIGTTQDVTDRNKGEDRLREYERVVERLDEMILVVDRQYRYVIANRAFLKFRGLSAQDVVGSSVDEVVGKEIFATLVREKMDECFRGRVVEYEMTYNFPNLGQRYLSAAYFPIDGPNGIDRIACVL